MSVLAYHPETGHSAVLSEEQLSHMRLGGWMLKAEYDAQQAAQAAPAEAAAQASKPAPGGKDK
jgi:hypothetical protein